MVEIISNIRKIISDKFSEDLAQKTRILYGGSVDSKNVVGFTKEKEIDGVLVGGASLKAEEFIKIVEKVSKK